MEAAVTKVTRLIIKERAEAQGLNISTLARRADLSRDNVHKYWNDSVTSFNRQTLDRIAFTLGLKVSDLFEGEPRMPERLPRDRRSA